MTVAEVERIGAPQISRQDARKAYLDYKAAVLKAVTPNEKREYEGLWRGYKAIAAGQQVINVQQAISKAGIQEDTLFPRLALCRADIRTCRAVLRPNGGVEFYDDALQWKYHKRKLAFPAGTLPVYTQKWTQGGTQRYRPSGMLERENWTDEATALVPIVPPRLHPRGALKNYEILWDAVWTPAPPKDPMLLKHLSGHLYAIVAVWDLTELERAVMTGRL